MISFRTIRPDAPEFIFIPGGLTDPVAYTPLARKLCENGISVHIIKMPYRMAKFGYNKINDLFDFDDPNQMYILGGHSQGAKMAAQFVHENPDKLKALIIMGTSHPRDFDLSYSTLPTLKLYAEHDGLASTREVLENEDKLPIGTKLRMIEGGNHSQFGNLGHLLGDDAATITTVHQRETIVEEIVFFLKSIK